MKQTVNWIETGKDLEVGKPRPDALELTNYLASSKNLQLLFVASNFFSSHPFQRNPTFLKHIFKFIFHKLFPVGSGCDMPYAVVKNSTTVPPGSRVGYWRAFASLVPTQSHSSLASHCLSWKNMVIWWCQDLLQTDVHYCFFYHFVLFIIIRVFFC